MSPAAAEAPVAVDRKRSPVKTSEDCEAASDEETVMVLPPPKKTKPPPTGMWRCLHAVG